MGLLGDLFDDVVDIVSAPVKFAGKIADDITGETDVEGWVNDTTNSIKTKKTCSYCDNGKSIPTGMQCNKCGRAK